MKVLVGISGSVAVIKLVELVKLLRRFAEVKIVASQRSLQFVTPEALVQLEALAGGILTDEKEWMNWREKGDPILHIELRKWADVFLLCPLSANSLAKIAAGMCDNLLTSVVRAWPLKDSTKRLVVCPAMNTCMWENPLTESHLNTLRQVYNASIISPKEMHLLACGDIGAGALADVQSIADFIVGLR